MRRLVLLAAVLWPLMAPGTALAPTATVGEFLHGWQAVRVAKSHAALQHRPDFRVERSIRLDRYKVRVCWSEPGYLSVLDGRDSGCDVVELRGRSWFLFDDQAGGGWMRFL